jgi:hypothetical protein
MGVSIVVVIPFVVAVMIFVVISVMIFVVISVMIPIPVMITIMVAIAAAPIIPYPTSISSAPTMFAMRVAVILPHPTVPAITVTVMDSPESTIRGVAGMNGRYRPKRGRVSFWSRH